MSHIVGQQSLELEGVEGPRDSLEPQAETQLAELDLWNDASEHSRLRLQAAALKAADNAIVITDREGIIRWVNPAFTKLTGFPAQEAIGASPRILKSGVHDGQFYREIWATILGSQVWKGKIINRRRNGTLYTEEMTITPVADERGQIQNFIAIKQDVSERERILSALQRSEKRYRALFQNAPAGIFRVALDGALFAVNPALVSMLGYEDEEQLLRVNLARQVFVEPLEMSRRFGESACGTIPPVEVEWLRKDGQPITVRLAGQRVQEPGFPDTLIMTAENVTQTRVLEEQLRQAQKMEAIGQLAGGIAHDFNNLLGVVIGYGELLKEKLAGDERATRALSAIIQAGERGADLTRQLLAFSRKQALQPKVLRLDQVVADTARILTRLIGEDVELKTHSDPDLGLVRVDPGQMQQVLMNLVVNARDAMPGGGRIRIETRNTMVELERSTRSHPIKPGAYVTLSVSDTGCGMDAATQARIFEPFFTTKAMGKGTGLGLATVYGIVKQSEGYIWVYSEVGVGTTFRIYLPQVAAGSAAAVRWEQPATAPQGAGAILLVEDDTPLRQVTREFLEGGGYTVLESSHIADALRLAGSPGVQIDLLLTDVVMPGMNGRDLAEQVQRLRPGVRVLYVSGCIQETVLHHGLLDPGVPLLEKPYSRQDLLRKVYDVMRHQPAL
jgi:PAS domain S-box-containing protein